MADERAYAIPVHLTELAPGVVLVELLRDDPRGASVVLTLTVEPWRGPAA